MPRAPFPDRSRIRAPFLRGHYPASSVLRAHPPPCRPGLPLAGFRLPCARLRTGFPEPPRAKHRTGLPVLLLPSSSMRASASTPAEAGRCACRSLPGSPAAFPCYWEGRLPHWAFRGLLSVHCTFRPACSLNRPRRPFSPSASTHVVTSMNRSAATSWSDSCCAGFAPA